MSLLVALLFFALAAVLELIAAAGVSPVRPSLVPLGLAFGFAGLLALNWP